MADQSEASFQERTNQNGYHGNLWCINKQDASNELISIPGDTEIYVEKKIFKKKF